MNESFIIVHGIGDEVEGKISGLWLNSFSEKIKEKFTKNEYNQFINITDSKIRKEYNGKNGKISVIEPRWEKVATASKINIKIFLYFLPLFLFNIMSFITVHEEEINAIYQDDSKDLDKERKKYSFVWIACGPPIIALGFVFFLGLKCFLIFCSVIFIIIFVWSKISKKISLV